jgi:Leucine-rich repeat (LRR) protein
MRPVLGCGSLVLVLTLCLSASSDPGGQPPSFSPEITTIVAETLAEEHLHRELDRETKIDVIETPLADVIKDIGKDHEVAVLFDPEGLEEAGVTPDQIITLNLKGISLRSALRTLLEPLHLTYVVRNEAITITSLDCSEARATTQVAPVKSLLAAIGKPEELLAALQTGWGKPGRCEPKATIVAGQLVIRGSPRHHQQAEKLIADLYTSLEIPPPTRSSPLSRWVPGKVVSLRNMKVQPEHLKLLAGQVQIRELDLSFNGDLHDNDMLVLTTLPDLTSLSLSDISIGESTLSIVAGLKSLESLDLSSTHVGDSLDKLLAALPKLRHLRLEGASLANLEFLRRAPNLESLDIQANMRLTEDDLDALGGLKHLKRLNLRELPITKVGLQKLAGLKSLEQLELGHSRYCMDFDRRNLEEVPWPHCTAADVAELQKQLPDCKIEAILTEFRRTGKHPAVVNEEDDPFGK